MTKIPGTRMQAYHWQFSIGRGMVAIAGIAVLFAVLPAGLSLAVFALTLSWIFVLRDPRLDPSTRGQALGCISCLSGFLGGAIIGAIWVRYIPAFFGRAGDVECGLPLIGAALGFGAVGAITAGAIAYAAIHPSVVRSTVRTVSAAERTKAEVELIEQLLSEAKLVGDGDVSRKLAEYRDSLLRQEGGYQEGSPEM